MSTTEFTRAACWGGRPVAYKIADAAPRGRVLVTGAVCRAEVVVRYGTISYFCLLGDGTGEIGLRLRGRRSVARHGGRNPPRR